jgi:hypothetical protein
MPEQKPPPKPQAPVESANSATNTTKPGPGSAPQKPPPPDNIAIKFSRGGGKYYGPAKPDKSS